MRCAQCRRASTPSAASRSGCSHWCPCSAAIAIASARSCPCVSHAVVSSGASSPARVDGAEVERRDDRRSVALARTCSIDGVHDRALGSVGVGLPRQAFDLDVHEHPVARVERFGERRHVGSRRARTSRTPRRRAARSPATSRVVVHDEHVVGGAPHVELDAVGAQCRAREREGLERVLRRLRRRATVSRGRAGARSLPPAYGAADRNTFQQTRCDELTCSDPLLLAPQPTAECVRSRQRTWRTRL